MKLFGKVARVVAGVFCAVMVLVCMLAFVVGNFAVGMFSQPLTMVLGANDYTVSDTTDEVRYASAYEGPEERHDAAAKLAFEIEQEGIVLLANRDGALPLAHGARVSVFGQDSVDFVYGGAGSGSIDASSAQTFREALEQAGLEVNPVLWDFYDTGAGAGYRKTVPDVTGAGGFEVNEVPLDAYTNEVRDSYADYADAAIVVIGRSGSESTDLPADYLTLTAEELDTIHEARANFDRVVLVLNTSNPIELGGIEDAGVDAVLWVGSPGQAGIGAVGDVLAGLVNPSGALVDTYAADNDSAPAMVNFGDYEIINSDVASGDKYLSYSEGIYVGYRYYETRYEDAVMGTGNAGDFSYAKEVVYPFGHGLSYTDFTWSDYAVFEGDDSFVASVTVTNAGDVAGKDVVQVYLQQPFTDYDRRQGIEKSAVQLVGYAKTDLLEPGESQVVSVEVSREELRAYDSRGAGTYVLEPGTYYLTAAPDAHAAANNVLAAKGYTTADGMTSEGDASMAWAYEQAGELDSMTYAVSQVTGETISNEFDDADMRTWDDGFTYLSRSDWQGTWPTTYADGAWKAPEEFVAALEVSHEADDAAEMPSFSTVSDEYGEVTLASLVDADYDDPRWDALLSQMGKQELWDLVRKSGYLSLGIPSIAMPQVTLKDGPAGISATLTGGGVSCMSYPSEIVLASTWNVELAEQMGEMVGEDGLSAGVQVWYAPSMNIHRTAYSGRNFEYYAEDPVLSGTMGAAEVRGAESRGLIATIKHFAVNDQETNRYGGAMLANEQAIREVYLRPFELAVREGDPSGVMVSMNRVGPRWVGGIRGLMTDTLRGEWGFDGFATTDQTTFPNFAYCDIYEGLEAGTDMWLNAADLMFNVDVNELDATTMTRARESAHRILYAYANSAVTNGLTPESSVTAGWLPTWQLIRLAVSVLLVLFTWVWVKLFHLCFGTRTLWQVIRKKPKKRGLRY